MHSSLAIANEFLTRAKVEKRALTQMQLQKLVYLAHGWSLAVTGESLVEDKVEAWAYGPVFRKLHDALRRYGASGVRNFVRWGDDTPFPQDDRGIARADLLPEEQQVVSEIWESFKGMEAFQLSALTHQTGSPWEKHFVDGENRVIPDDDIREHFIRLADAA